VTRLLAAIPLALVAVAAAAATPAAHVVRTVDTGLCPFPLHVSVTSRDDLGTAGTSFLHFTFAGPSTITLRNGTTGRSVTLESSGPFSTNTKTGSVSFRGHQVWYWSTGNHVPFLTTDGTGAFKAPTYVLTGSARPRVVDPCALVAPVRPRVAARTTRAPWPLPAYALTRIARAGLVPVLATLRRHDHVHLDVIVDGRHVTVPAGVGLAEPDDTGPCKPPQPRVGDCAAGDFYVAQVANSPLHTHSASGLIHVESDRPVSFTLGQFFDEWGVRLDARCVGAYCSGGGKELRAYVDGRRFSGSPRSVVLTDHQEIAVVYGARGAFGAVPKTFRGGWPGLGCGGRGEHSCLP
jgi:hypothetical protein